MQILFEGVTTTQLEFGAFVICLVLILMVIFLCIKQFKQCKTLKEQFIVGIMCLVIIMSTLIPVVNQRINYETIHTKKITFTEQQNLKVNDEITFYPELQGYKVTEIEGKIYTVELREKR